MRAKSKAVLILLVMHILGASACASSSTPPQAAALDALLRIKPALSYDECGQPVISLEAKGLAYGDSGWRQDVLTRWYQECVKAKEGADAAQ